MTSLRPSPRGPARVGWTLIVGALASLAAAAVLPLGSHTDEAAPVSSVGRRYRAPHSP